MKEQSDSEKLLGKETGLLLVVVDVVPRGVSISNGHLSTEHFGGGGCKAIE